MVDIKLEVSGPGAEMAKEVASGCRGALRRVLGPALTEFGEMLGDQMKLWRFERLLKLRDKVEAIVLDRDMAVAPLQPLPFGDAVRTIEAASFEDDDSVQDMWARLIVNGASAAKPGINKLHIEILRSLSSADSALLELLYPSVAEMTFHSKGEVDEFNDRLNGKAESRWRQFPRDERDVSIQNLIRLRCITATPRAINIDRLLTRIPAGDGRTTAAGIEPRKFNELVSDLVKMIYESSGAIQYDTESPIPLHYKGDFGAGHGVFGLITVPELNHMLTPLGVGFMKAVTLDKTEDVTSPA